MPANARKPARAKAVGLFVPLTRVQLARFSAIAAARGEEPGALAGAWLAHAIQVSGPIAARATHARYDAGALAILRAGERGVPFALEASSAHDRAIAEILDAHDPNWREKLEHEGRFALSALLVELLNEAVRPPPPDSPVKRPKRAPVVESPNRRVRRR